ncbi:MAG: DUF3021 domain-containing protein [Lachnospiraceae bacterium]|nr:DUF3021 domain-containing protein [Lachnospiraceae bacterium]
MKSSIVRFIYGFTFGITISMVVQLGVMSITGAIPMLPEYMAGFANPVMAYSVQMLFIGLISGVASAGTVILEWKRPGLLIQSILYLVLMLGTWIPVACYLWGFHKYTTSMVSGLLSILGTYTICWVVQYHICSRDVKEINQRLKSSQEG